MSTLAPMSAAHWLGADDLGRDTLSRLIYGGTASLYASFLAVFVAILIGVPVGLLAGYLGGWVDEIISRIIDSFLSFPAIVLAIAVTGALGIGLLALAKPAHAAGDGRHAAWLGNLLVFAAVLCEASYAVIGKKLTAVMSPKRISSIINLWGFALMTPLGLYAAVRFDFVRVGTGMWLLLVFYGLAASVWTVWLWMTGLKSVPAAQAGVFTVMLPVSAALVGVVVLGESLTGIQMIAFAVSLAGILLATVPQSRAGRAAAPRAGGIGSRQR